MTLREQIAKRLKDAFLGGGNPETDNDHESDWLDAADECIRQMEWARRETVTPGWTIEVGGPVSPRKVIFNQMDTLTAAPDDWTTSTTQEDQDATDR